tara:strand:+ start:1686 stop:2753 length:1068 start_codon:yes stop_codon:yes gene_type:complete
MVKIPKIHRTIELFCGPGGLGYGAILAKAGQFKCKHVYAIDIDESSCETYAKNICNGNRQTVQRADLNKYYPYKKLPDCEGLLFGFPCNDFSLVGEKKGLSGKYGGLYKAGVKCLKAKRPLWFLAENVSGISNKKDDFVFRKILKELKNCDYVLNVHKYKFEQYGVPQKRHRYIIVGIRSDVNKVFKPPIEKITDPKSYITAAETFETIKPYHPNQELPKHSNAVIKRLENTLPGDNAWSNRLPDKYRLKGVKGAKLSQIYKKLKPNEPSYTVTGSGGGGTHMYHWSENRALTNRERASLQTFPNSYEFFGSKEQIRKQIGMAVPVKMAKIIITSILKTFANKAYKSINKSNYII